VRVLVVCAHPDDEVLGAGGTIARHAKDGDTVDVAILATGIASRGGEPNEIAKQLAGLRENAKRASALLGVTHLELGEFEDQAMDAMRLLDIVRAVEAHVRRVRPEVVYTHHHGDLNADHRLTYQAVLTATRPVAEPAVRRILSFEISPNTDLNVPNLFAPTVYVDISTTIEKKIAALEAYEGEVRAFPHPRSREALVASSQRWGSVANMRNAEAFQLVRELR
jgi:LmbE family N-acetylglucosaminyl deacetylase